MIVRRATVLETELSGQIVLLNTETDRCHEATGVGVAIWQFLAQPRTEAEIVDHLVSRYPIARERCAEDVSRFLSKLRGAALIDGD